MYKLNIFVFNYLMIYLSETNDEFAYETFTKYYTDFNGNNTIFPYFRKKMFQMYSLQIIYNTI